MITQPGIKINLGLEVLRKRPDGYHDLETLFYPLDNFHDTLEVVKGDEYCKTLAGLTEKYGSEEGKLVQAISEDGKIMITIARKEGVHWDPLKDLTVKAYRLLEADFELPAVKICLEKTSPVGAGLGGGSADGAFALKMINEIFSLGLSKEALVGYASRLGSDCALFIYNEPVMGEGRGEILTPYPLDLKGYRIEVTPFNDISVSTAEAYGGIVPRDVSGQCGLPLKEILAMPVEKWKGLLVNDFEETVFRKHPVLAAEKEKLYEKGAVYASMSGSGSALFAIYKV